MQFSDILFLFFGQLFHLLCWLAMLTIWVLLTSACYSLWLDFTFILFRILTIIPANCICNTSL